VGGLTGGTISGPTLPTVKYPEINRFSLLINIIQQALLARQLLLLLYDNVGQLVSVMDSRDIITERGQPIYRSTTSVYERPLHDGPRTDGHWHRPTDGCWTTVVDRCTSWTPVVQCWIPVSYY